MFWRFIHVVAGISKYFAPSIPAVLQLYGYTTFSLFIHQLMNFWVASSFWLLLKCCYERVYTRFCVNVFSFLLDVYLGVELLGHMVTLSLTFWVIVTLFQSATSFKFPPAVSEGFHFPTSSSVLVIVCLYFTILVSVQVLNIHWPIVYILWKWLLKSFSRFSGGLFFYWVLKVLFIF